MVTRQASRLSIWVVEANGKDDVGCCCCCEERGLWFLPLGLRGRLTSWISNFVNW